jgi:ubiquitin-conjugating enzyme E2 Q
MPRKDFLRDLERARASPPGSFPGLRDIRLGDDDESICFSFSSRSHSDPTLEFQAVISGEPQLVIIYVLAQPANPA